MQSSAAKNARLLSNLPPTKRSVFPRILHPLSPNQFGRQRLKQTQRIATAKILGQKSAFQMHQGRIVFCEQMVELALDKLNKGSPHRRIVREKPRLFQRGPHLVPLLVGKRHPLHLDAPRTTAPPPTTRGA